MTTDQLAPMCWRCRRRDRPLIVKTYCAPCMNAVIAEQDGNYDPELEAEGEAYARFGVLGGLELER